MRMKPVHRLPVLVLLLLMLVVDVLPAAAALAGTRKIPDYKPLEIYGEKLFVIDDVDVQGNLGRFATENYEAVPGFRYSSQLRLTLDGNVAQNIRLNAQIDDTNLQKEDKQITVNIHGKQFLATLGDFQTSFADTNFTLNTKKLKGMEFYAWQPRLGEMTLIASRSEGKNRTQLFTGAGMQAEFLLASTPVVKGSETLKLDGRPLRRGTDYTIDYEEGSFALDQKLLPLESRNRLEMEYEYYPDGSHYRRTLMGLRARAFLGPDDYIATTLLSDADEKGNPEDIPAGTDAAPPTAHRVAGFDFRLHLPKDVELVGEYAFSSIDPNTLTKLQTETIKSGHAGRIKLSRKSEPFDLAIMRVEMDPKFDSVGMERLVLDRELTDMVMRWKPVEQIETSLHLDTGRSLTQGDPDLPASSSGTVAVRRDGIVGDLTWRPHNDTKLVFSGRSRKKINRDAAIHFDEFVRDASVKTKIRGVEHTLRWNIRELIHDFQPVTDRCERTISGGLAGNWREWLTLSLDGGVISAESGVLKERESDIRNINLALTARPGSKFFASATVGDRFEERFREERREHTQSGDIRLRWQPSEAIQCQARYNEVLTKKFIVDVHDALERTLPTTEQQKDQIIQVEEPVSTATGSLVFHWTPDPGKSAMAQYQYKDITNRETNQKMAESDSAMMEIKTSPLRNLVTIFKSLINKNRQYAGNPYDSDSAIHEVEVRRSFGRRTSLIGTVGFEVLRDSYTPAQDKDKWDRRLKVERSIGRSLFAHAGYASGQLKRFSPDRRTEEDTWLAGLRFTPSSIPLTLRGNIEHKTENDLGRLDERTTFDTLLNFQVDEDTSVESNYRWIKRSATIFEPGYDARVGKVTVTRRF